MRFTGAIDVLGVVGTPLYLMSDVFYMMTQSCQMVMSLQLILQLAHVIGIVDNTLLIALSFNSVYPSIALGVLFGGINIVMNILLFLPGPPSWRQSFDRAVYYHPELVHMLEESFVNLRLFIKHQPEDTNSDITSMINWLGSGVYSEKKQVILFLQRVAATDRWQVLQEVCSRVFPLKGEASEWEILHQKLVKLNTDGVHSVNKITKKTLNRFFESEGMTNSIRKVLEGSSAGVEESRTINRGALRYEAYQERQARKTISPLSV